MYHNRTSAKKSSWRVVLIVFIALILLTAGGVLLAARRYYYQNLKAFGTNNQPIIVTIPEGSSVRQIAVVLKENRLIRDIRVFEHYVKSKGAQDKLQAGVYELRQTQDVAGIVDSLTAGAVQTNLITIVPGQRIDQIKKTMVDHGFNVTAVAAAFNPDLYKDHPALADKPAGASLEGYLYPESFQKTASTSPTFIVRQSLDQMQTRLTPDLKAKFAARGLTVHQAITLASVVEREVPNAVDRATVAQIFLKRLSQNMKLESDATASYGAVLAGQAPLPAFSSAYNTYQHAGLPPGPVSNVSDVSLGAVANPTATDWLYFVSGDDGKTYFSHSLAEHIALVKAHCKQHCAPH